MFFFAPTHTRSFHQRPRGCEKNGVIKQALSHSACEAQPTRGHLPGMVRMTPPSTRVAKRSVGKHFITHKLQALPKVHCFANSSFSSRLPCSYKT